VGKNVNKKVVIVFLHNNFNSYLLQLRDFKPSIIFPGHWGAFGGTIEEGESPKDALDRELIEEIGYCPEELKFFGQVNKDQQKLNIHMFHSSMGVSLSKLRLMEGVDMGLFTVEEILSKNLYSKKLGDVFPMVPLLSELFEDFFEHVAKNIKAL
jgi:8-oxo-dGTP diphosphatase